MVLILTLFHLIIFLTQKILFINLPNCERVYYAKLNNFSFYQSSITITMALFAEICTYVKYTNSIFMEICCRIWMNYNPMVDRSEYKYWIYRIFSSLSKPKNIGQFFPYYCIFSQRTFLKNLKFRKEYQIHLVFVSVYHCLELHTVYIIEHKSWTVNIVMVKVYGKFVKNCVLQIRPFFATCAKAHLSWSKIIIFCLFKV